jgi:hypothetical protein
MKSISPSFHLFNPMVSLGTHSTQKGARECLMHFVDPVSRSTPTYRLEVTALPPMTRQAAGAGDSTGTEPKQMSTGVGEDIRHALREDDVVGRSHRVARRTLVSAPTWRANCQMFKSKQPTGGVNPRCTT